MSSTGQKRLLRSALTLMAMFGPGCSHSGDGLVQKFQAEHVFWQQFEVAQTMVSRHDRSVLPDLVGYLNDDDRHERANAAYVFAGLGEQRGFDVLIALLSDLSDRQDGQGRVDLGRGIMPMTGPVEQPRHTAQQIAADRYYAANLLGELRDTRAVPPLISVLNVPEVNMAAIWSLAEIGDHRSVSPLILVLRNGDPTVRVAAIRALEQLRAKEAIPALRGLLTDPEKSHVDDLISVADAARHALSRLE